MVDSARLQAECISLGIDIYICRKLSSGELEECKRYKKNWTKRQIQRKKCNMNQERMTEGLNVRKIINTYHNCVIIIKTIIIIKIIIK